jgi:NAD(P)-dependent dehydrogenase (short-subunit alcohol dehydrogenase family)
LGEIVQAFAPDLFAGRHVLVIGGTSGIGLGCALAFRELGADVTATGASAAECARAAQGASGRIAFVELDVRDGPAVRTLIGGLAKLDVLINAAGVIRRDEEHDPEVFAQVVAVNLTGAMTACAAAKPKLEESGGCVVNVASVLTFFGGPRVPAYAASKGGIGQLTKSLVAARRASASMCGRAGLDRDAAHAGSAGGRGEERAHPRPHADGALGHARGGRRRHRFSCIPRRSLHHRRHPRHRRRVYGGVMFSISRGSSRNPRRGYPGSTAQAAGSGSRLSASLQAGRPRSLA